MGSTENAGKAQAHGLDEAQFTHSPSWRAAMEAVTTAVCIFKPGQCMPIMVLCKARVKRIPVRLWQWEQQKCAFDCLQQRRKCTLTSALFAGEAGGEETEGDLKTELNRKDAHDKAFGLGSYKMPKERASGRERSERSGSIYERGGESLSSGELLRYVENGGSLFNVPGKRRKGEGAGGDEE